MAVVKVWIRPAVDYCLLNGSVFSLPCYLVDSEEYPCSSHCAERENWQVAVKINNRWRSDYGWCAPSN